MSGQIRVERPAGHEVFQRQAGKASVPVRIAGLTQASVTVLALDGAQRVVARRDFGAERGVVCGEMEVPEGGWYWLAVSAGRRRRLTPFGVGDVFVVAGQSNAAGGGDGFIPDRSGMVAALNDLGEWVLADNAERMLGRMAAGSPWPTLGELLAVTERVPIGFINVAVGGTSTEQWLPAGELYPALGQALHSRRVRAVLWHQGESDAIGSFALERTYENMAAIIERSRADAGWRVPWYVALASYSPGITPQQQAAVRTAQAALHHNGVALPGPDTDTYVPESMRHDKLHFGQVGLVVHAILWFRALWFAGRPPEARAHGE